MRRLAAAAALLLALAGLTVPTPAAAAPASCSGVWVVVESSVGCADSYSSGLVALRSAGHQVETTGGMICRIDGAPATCVVSTSAYWSYWHAKRNADGSYGPWTYSNKGAGEYRPVQGDAEGWTFGAGKSAPPGRPPVAPVTQPAPPPPAPPATTQPATSVRATTTAPTGTRAPATTQASSGPRSAASPDAPTPEAPPSIAPSVEVATPDPAADAVVSPAAAPAASPTPTGPSGPATAVFALGALALGGVGTAWAVKRRRTP